jgi:beta-glucosidase
MKRRIFCLALALSVLGLLFLRQGLVFAQDAPAGNILKNSGFDQDVAGAPGIDKVKGSSYWFFGLNGGGAGGKAALEISDGVAHVKDYSDGGTAVYSIQLIQAPISVVQGFKYRLSFEARAATKRAIKVKVGGVADRGWVDYTKGTGDGTEFGIDTTAKVYKLDFNMTDATDDNARFEFQLGLSKSDVWIGKPSLEVIGKAPLPPSAGDGKLKNGDFASVVEPWQGWSNLASWSGEAELELSVKDGELLANVVKAGTISSNPLVRQYGLSFVKGKSYTVSFKARSSDPKAIQVSLGKEMKADPFYLPYAPTQVFQLGEAMQPYAFSFIMAQEPPTDGYGKLSFELGAVDGKSVAALVHIADVKIVEQAGAAIEISKVSPTEIVKNGNFDIGAEGWKADGSAQIAVESQALTLRTGSSGLGSVRQGGIRIGYDQGYLLSFVAGAAEPGTLALSLASSDKQLLPASARGLKLDKGLSYFQFYLPPGDSVPDCVLSFTALPGEKVRLDRISIREAGEWMDASKSPEERTAALLGAMSLDEKLGQMVQSERSAVKEGDLANYGIGSILSGGGSVPTPNTPAAWVSMYNRFQAEALATRLAIPMIYGVDAVHGHGNAAGATIFPHNIGLGATRDPALVERVAAATAEEMAATGLDWDFGPCVAVARDERWGRTYESFGESPELQSLLTASYVRGLQGDPSAPDFMRGAHVVATAKHFLGDGGAEWKTGEGSYTIDRGDIRSLDLAAIKSIHAVGYKEAIRMGVGAVMASFSKIGGLHMHANKALLTDYLKAPVASGGLGFEGFVVGDWDAMSLLSEVEGTFADKVLAGFNAGIDMSMEQSRWKEVIADLGDGLASGAISQERIDDAAARILKVKFKSGLFDSPWALGRYADTFGGPAHRAIAAQAVKESLVLLKNEKSALPLKAGTKIFVSGPLADNIGYQCGGWTIQWQGLGDPAGGRLVPGTSILDGLRAAAAASGGQIVTDISKAKGCSAAVVVVGETPYAEGVGDLRPASDLTLGDTLAKAARGNLEAIAAAKALKVPVIVVIVSGRPLVVTDQLKDMDALVAAWLPGSEGGAIADVLFGKDEFVGKLPMTWPRNVGQLPINQGDPDYAKKAPLFPYGFGLSMRK